MAISRMQQPRQMYGLGSFVKKAVRKITRPVTKIAGKLVPKEIAGIMRTAAPFLPPGYREAAYLLGTAKQTGRISPMDLALAAAPTFFDKTQTGQNLANQFKTSRLGKFLVGSKGTPGGPVDVDMAYSPPGIAGSGQAQALTGQTVTVGSGPTSGILGKGGEFLQLGKGTLPGTGTKQDFGILETKAGKFLLGGEDGGFSKAKLAGIGLSTLSLIQSAKTPDEAGKALVSATGNSDDYERGVQLFSQLTPELFEVPEQFRAKDGGRIGFKEGTTRRGGLRSMAPDMAVDPKSDFFEDLFLNRAGGGGRDYIIPERAVDFKKYYRETKEFPGLKVLDAPEGVNIFTSAEQAEKINFDIAKELEAERILPSLYSKAMTVIDAIQDIDNEETKMKMINDVNKSFDRTEGSGSAKAANAYYRIIQKYGYLLDRPKGLGSMIRDLGQDPDPLDSRKPEKAGGGLMRTNYAKGSDDDPKPLPEDPTKPINPFGPKPIGPVLPDRAEKENMKVAGGGLRGEKAQEIAMQIAEEEYGQDFYDLPFNLQMKIYEIALQMYDERGMAKGGRVNYALGTRPTAEESGLGGLPIEADMRYTGGFMPYGAKEKADDVPARLSKNEFVFTADAVRAAGGGSVNEGAKKMYATMKNLEAKPEAKGMMA